MKKFSIIPWSLLLLAYAPKAIDHDDTFNYKQFEGTLRLINGGSYFFGPADIDRPSTPNDLPISATKTVEMQPFYISDHEVTNAEYVQFLSSLRKADPVQWKKMLPDTMVWKSPTAYMEPFVEVYLRHPEYKNHPVVGVTHAQAVAYCNWLTNTYNAIPKRKYSSAHFRLPTEYEWWYAASGGLHLQSLPWGGPVFQDDKGKWRANFRSISQGNIERKRIDGNTNDVFVAYESGSDAEKVKGGNTTTCPVRSYSPNGFGLYDMAGNVEELVAEKGISKGGSWNDPGFYLQMWVKESYDEATLTSWERGFRIVMDVK